MSYPNVQKADLDDMRLRSTHFAEVHCKSDAIDLALEAIPSKSDEPAAVSALPILTANGSSVVRAAELLQFLQARRTQHRSDLSRGTQQPVEAQNIVTATQASDYPERAEELTDRIARLEERLSSLSPFEASVTELVARFGTIQATHVEPVRQAAQLEVRRALEVERCGLDGGALAAVEQVRDELIAVKKELKDEGQRLRKTLQSLSNSMERVVSRLDAIEGGARPGMQDIGLKGTIVEPPAPKQALLQPATRRRPLLEAIGLRRRGVAFA